MNKKIFLLGLVTIGLLLLGSLPTSVGEDSTDSGSFIGMQGAIDFSYDISLTSVWKDGAPHEGSATGLTNTNLRYNLTSMKSPLDDFFNVGYFMFGGESTDPMPEFMLNGTLEGSELFVKIVNDQTSVSNNRLLDWQASLTLKSDIDLAFSLPEGINTSEVPIDLLPTTLSIPAGSGIPPLPVVRSTTNFSYFEDLSELASSFGYDGLPFVTPAIFYIDNIDHANSYWTTEENLLDLIEPSDDPNDNHSVKVTTEYISETSFELTIDAVFFNTTTDFGNVSMTAFWNSTGWLTDFSVTLFADINESLTLDAEEEFSLAFKLVDTSKDPLPISVGDQGEYILNMDFSATVDLENDTEEVFVNTILDEIAVSINELDGEKLMSFTVDAMDGLYYHLDGYLLDLKSYVTDRLGIVFGSTSGSLPPIEDYYMPIGGMDDMGHDFALNLFDAQVYQNETMFYEVYDGYQYPVMRENETDGSWYQDYDWQSMDSEDGNTTYIEMHMPGIVNAMVFELSSWNFSLSLDDNLAALETMENYDGTVEYIEVEYSNWDSYYEEWDNGTYQTIEILSNGSFLPSTEYIAVLEIEPLPNSGFTSYFSKNNPYMMMGVKDGPDDGNDAGFGAMELDPIAEPMSSSMMPDPQSMIPLPARTPDWKEIGGVIVFLEAYLDQVADVITSDAFISYLEENSGDDPGDFLDIHNFDIGLDWIVNSSHAGAEQWFDLNMTMIDNNTGNMTIDTQSIVVSSHESYQWFNDGIFDTAMVSVQASIELSSEEWVIDTPDDTTTTTTTTTDESDTTTTETVLELTPGFEVVFTLGSLIALPLFFKKRR